MLTDDELKAQQVIAQLCGKDLNDVTKIDNVYMIEQMYSGTLHLMDYTCVGRCCQHNKFFHTEEEANTYIKENSK